MDSATYPVIGAQHPAIGSPNELAGPWRRAALVAFGFALLELVALVVIGVTLAGGPVVHWLLHGRTASKPSAAAAPATHAASAAAAAPAKPAKPAKRTPPAKPELSRARTHVLVLNGNGVTGAAHDTAATIATHGYPTPATGNASRTDYATSFVMYRPGYVREARRLGRDMSIHSVVPLDGRPAALHGAQLILILGK